MGGGIYLHCDPTMSHYLKLVMDAIFGRRNFRNEIVWRKYSGRKNNAKHKFTTQHDTILFFVLSEQAFFKTVFEPLSPEAIKEYRHIDRDGRNYRMARRGKGYETEGGEKRIYLDESPGSAIGNLWVEKGLQLGQGSRERTGYRTQKPLTLLRRIITASSNEGDMILDPFCGCATSCVAAEELQRQWVGIDIGEKAADLVQMRMKENLGMLYDGIHRTDIPQRTDLGKLPKYNSPANKTRLYGEQQGYCNGCSTHFEMRNLEVDHIIGRKVGGTDHLDNLQLLCGNCNRVKGNRGMEYLIARLKSDNTRRGY